MKQAAAMVSMVLTLLLAGAVLAQDDYEHYTPPPVVTPDHQSFTFASRAVGELRNINVYLPPAYAAGGDDRYPVLYMPDGGLEEDFPHVAATIDAGIRDGEMRPLILVGIENTQRRRDLTPPTTVAADSAIAPRVGGAADFRAFLADELMPEIARRYRATDDAGIIGESLAGLFIVDTFLRRPDLFDRAIALDPSLWWNADDLVVRAGDLAAARGDVPGTLFLASSDTEGIGPQTQRFVEAVAAAAPPHLTVIYEPRPDERHWTIYRAVGPEALRRLYAPER